MNREDFLKIKNKIRFYAFIIACLLVALLLGKRVLFVISNEITQYISYILFLFSYLMVIKLAGELKKKEIHGISAVAWSLFWIYLLTEFTNKSDVIVFQMIIFVSFAFYIFTIIDGSIRLLISLYGRIKMLKKDDVDIVNNIDSLIAIVTSIIAITISFIELI